MTPAEDLPATVDLAAPDEARCDYQPGVLRCVRRPHPEHPDAHVRVNGSVQRAGHQPALSTLEW